jgi:hypothetical protein
VQAEALFAALGDADAEQVRVRLARPVPSRMIGP